MKCLFFVSEASVRQIRWKWYSWVYLLLGILDMVLVIGVYGIHGCICCGLFYIGACVCFHICRSWHGDVVEVGGW